MNGAYDDDRIRKLYELAVAVRFAVIAHDALARLSNNGWEPRVADTSLVAFGLIGFINHFAASQE